MTVMPEYKDPKKILETDILRLLAYFDVFNYPLHKQQILLQLSDNSITDSDLSTALQSLVEKNIIGGSGDYYSLSSNLQHSLWSRMEHERRARLMLHLSRSVARLMKLVPFVRAIFLTGSLSKGVAPEEADIDFFIVTAPHRVWISRFLLTVMKKTLFLNNKRLFCINLFISEGNLQFNEQSFYNAVEIKTIVPIWNSLLYKSLHRQNEWVKSYFPKWVPEADASLLLPDRKTFIQHLAEKFLQIFPLDVIDTYLLERARSHWKKKYSHLNSEQFDGRIKCEEHISTVWPENVKSFIINSFEQRLEQLTRRLSLADNMLVPSK